MRKPSLNEHLLSTIVNSGISKVGVFAEKIGSHSLLARVGQAELSKKWEIVIYSVFFLSLLNLYFALLPLSGILARLSLPSEFVMIAAFLFITLRKPVHGLYLFALALPIITYRPLLAFILILFMALVVVKLDYSEIKKNLKQHLNFAALLFIFLLFVTAITSVYWKQSLSHFLLYNLVSFALYLLIIMLIAKRDILVKFITSLIISATFIALYGIYQYFTLDVTAAHWVDLSQNPGITKRIYSTFGNPNIFAQYLIMIIPFSFAFIFAADTWRKRLLFALCFAILSATIVLTFSRGGWVAIFVALVILATMINRRLLVLGLIGGAIGFNFLPPAIVNRISTIFNPQVDSSSSYRFQMWESARAMFQDYWFTGIGSDPNTFFKVYTDYMMPQVRIFHFHNIYIMAAITGGILLLAVLLYFFYMAMRTAVVSLYMNQGKDVVLGLVAKAALASFIAIAIAGLTEDIWRQYRVDFLFWIVIALIAVCYNIARKNIQSKEGDKQ